MTHVLPREKLQQQTIEALSTNEVLQLILGSGSVHRPVRRLARSVQKLIDSKDAIDVKDFLALPGFGVTQASRMVACFELASRYRSLIPHRTITLAGNSDFVFYYDGAGRILRSQPLMYEQSLELSAKTVIGSALRYHAQAIELRGLDENRLQRRALRSYIVHVAILFGMQVRGSE